MLSKNEKPVESNKPTVQQDLTMDEKIAVEVYEAMKSKKKSKDVEIEAENDDLNDEDEPMETNENEGLFDIIIISTFVYILSAVCLLFYRNFREIDFFLY